MISIIIPVFNEANVIADNLQRLRTVCSGGQYEIIVVDGGSTDDTVRVCQAKGAVVVKSEKGRGRQMNFGASVAKGDVLYFLHADSLPPSRFDYTIQDANKRGAKSGCFKLAFDYDHWFLRTNAWFTRFNVNAIRFGDQSLFVTKEVFEQSGGFREDLMVMEDQEIIHRLKKYGKFVVMNGFVTTSARKYLDNGIFNMQWIFFRIWTLYYLGYSQKEILKVYRKLVVKHKL